MSNERARDEEVPLGEYWRRNRPRTKATAEEQRDRLRPAPDSLREDRHGDRDDAQTRRADRLQREDATRRATPTAVDLYAIDAMYARSAANGMADIKGKHLAVDIAVEEAAQRRSGGNRRPAPPTQRDRARAAQRWEQNREYVESRHEDRDRKQ